MWLILICGFDGCGPDAVQLARDGQWRAEAALVGFARPEDPTWLQTWYPADVDEISSDARFESQRECLTALRRAIPEGERRSTYANSGEGWELENVVHGPDYVERFAAVGWVEGSANMMRTYYYGCFRAAPRMG